MSPETTRDRLKVIAPFGARGCTPAEFAARAYPDSREWRKPVRRRGTKAGKLIRSAAGVLGRLRARGLVDRTPDGRYFISPGGKDFMMQRQEVPPTVPDRPRAKAWAAAPAQWVQTPLALGGWLWWDGARFWWPDGRGGLQYWGPAAC